MLLTAVFAHGATAWSVETPAWQWDHRPVVSYADDTCLFAWRVHAPAAMTAQLDNEALPLLTEDKSSQVAVIPGSKQQLIVRAGEAELFRARLLAPQHGAELALDRWGWPAVDEQPAVLVVRERPAELDRRWAWLRGFQQAQGAVSVITAPVVPWGHSPLLAQVVASQKDVRDKQIVVLLSDNERHVAWKHRDFRQVLCWLMEDLLLRGARSITVVQAPVPAYDRKGMEGLWEQTRLAARAYGADVVETFSLSADQYWQVAPGVFASDLNEAGQAALTLLLQQQFGSEFSLK